MSENATDGEAAQSGGAQLSGISWRRAFPWIVAVICFSIMLPAFYGVAMKRVEIFNHESNTNLSEIDGKDVSIIFHFDQHVYLNIGRMMKRSGYTYEVPRHRTPGYPFLLSFFYSDNDAYPLTEGDSRRVSDAYFSRGRTFNIILSMACLVAIFLFTTRVVSVWTSLLFTISLAWFLFIFRAPYTQPELLYTTCSFFAFILLGKQILNPTWIRGIGLAVLLAASFMLKAAILPLIALFVACFALKFFVVLYRQIRFSNEPPKKIWSSWFISVSKGAIVPILFVTLLSPYLLNNLKKYGNPFWSVHSQHFMWLESREDKHQWRQLLPMIDENGGRVPEGAPTKERYLKNHTWGDFIDRAYQGAINSFNRIELEYYDGYRFLNRRLWRVSVIVAVLSFLLMIPVVRNKFASADSPQMNHSIRKYWILIPYFVLFALGYSLLYGSYQMIGAGPRLFLSMFPVVVFGLWLIVEKFSPVIKVRSLRVPTLPIFQAAIVISLVGNLVHTFRNELYHAIGGG